VLPGTGSTGQVYIALAALCTWEITDE